MGGDVGASGGRLEQALKVKRFWCSGMVGCDVVVAVA